METNKKPNQELLQKWITALRSGEYTQTYSALKKGNDFCCLGVLCSISGEGKFDEAEWWIPTSKGIYSAGYFLPSDLQEALNLRLSDVKDLTLLNDQLLISFAEIADIIEITFDGVYGETNGN